MNINNPTKTSSNRAYNCDFCGDLIPQETHYYCIIQEDNPIPQNTICHCHCYDIAVELGLIERGYISRYTFRKRLIDFIVDLHKKGGGSIKRKTVERYSVSHLTMIVNNYFNDRELQKDKYVSKETMREILSLYIMLFMMPRIIDDLIYDLEEAKMYKHKTKQIIKGVLSDFEKMSESLSALYGSKTQFMDDLIDNSMDVYEKIQEAVSLQGVDRSANILFGLVDVIAGKYDKISKEVKVRDNVKQIMDIKLKLNNILRFNKHKIIDFLMNDLCSSKGITIVDEKR